MSVFTERFVVVDVFKPIVGVDILGHYSLLVDMRNQCLLDSFSTYVVILPNAVYLPSRQSSEYQLGIKICFISF